MTHHNGILAFHGCNKTKTNHIFQIMKRLTISPINLYSSCITRENCLHLSDCGSQEFHGTDTVSISKVIGTLICLQFVTHFCFAFDVKRH